MHLSTSLKHNICTLFPVPVDCTSVEALERHCINSHRITQNETSKDTTPRLGKTQVTSQSMDQNRNGNTEQSNDYGNDGIPSDLVTPVFKIACRLRSPDLTAETVLIASKSRLHLSIIGAIIRAALRVLPVDNSPEGYLKRIERERLSAARAIENQDAFTECVARLGIKFYTEIEQRKIMDEKIDAKGRPARGPTVQHQIYFFIRQC